MVGDDDRDHIINTRTGEHYEIRATSGSLWFVAREDTTCHRCGTQFMTTHSERGWRRWREVLASAGLSLIAQPRNPETQRAPVAIGGSQGHSDIALSGDKESTA